MKKSSLLAALCLAGFSVASMSAEDLWIYTGTDENPVEVKKLTDVKKIAFSDAAITVTAADGTETPVNLADFDFFSFAEKKPAGAEEITADGKTMVAMRGNLLTVKSTLPIDAVEVYSLQGIKLLGAAPQSAEFSEQLDVANGIYLVRVIANGKAEVHKIIKR